MDGWYNEGKRTDYSKTPDKKSKFSRLLGDRNLVLNTGASINEMKEVFRELPFENEELNMYTNYAPKLNLTTYNISENCFLVINSEIETERGLDNNIHFIPFIKGEDVYYEDNAAVGSIFDNVLRLVPKTEDYRLFRFKLAFKI